MFPMLKMVFKNLSRQRTLQVVVHKGSSVSKLLRYHTPCMARGLFCGEKIGVDRQRELHLLGGGTKPPIINEGPYSMIQGFLLVADCTSAVGYPCHSVVRAGVPNLWFYYKSCIQRPFFYVSQSSSIHFFRYRDWYPACQSSQANVLTRYNIYI